MDQQSKLIVICSFFAQKSLLSEITMLIGSKSEQDALLAGSSIKIGLETGEGIL